MKSIKKIIFVFIGALGAAAVISAAVILGLGHNMYRRALEAKPLAEAVESIREKDSFIDLDQLPGTYIDAVIAAEDHRFFEHGGVDILAVGRAAFNNLATLSLSEGGSTITQQLAKNIYYTQEKSFIRKAAELFTAFRIEAEYSKDEILELYVNTIYFGNGFYSVREAALGYFDKEPAEMTDYECTLLAGIPNAPSVYSPAENPDLAEERRKQVVQCMIKHGYISEEEGEELYGSLPGHAA